MNHKPFPDAFAEKPRLDGGRSIGGYAQSKSHTSPKQKKKKVSTTIHKKPRCVLLQVITPHYHRDDALVNMAEAEQLVQTFGGEVVLKEIQHKVHPHPSTYIGKGKLEWLIKEVKEKKIDIVIVNDMAKSGQLFRIEKALWDVNPQIKVWDRVGLILQIFELHASTTEAKLQIELARITHDGPRIYGLGKDALSRQGGGIGTRGSGETNIEQERRIIKDRQQKIKKELKKLHKRKQHSIRRRREQGLGPVALVGYTSAGKTTLFNALTGKKKEEHQKLFTTLDTVVGKMKTPDSRVPVLLSDTIGFIQNLPPLLIDAFQSTLLESIQAELILHVIDCSDERVLEKVEVVNQILEDLSVNTPTMCVFNKSDLASDLQKKRAQKVFGDKKIQLVSAKNGQGLGELKKMITQLLLSTKESKAT